MRTSFFKIASLVAGTSILAGCATQKDFPTDNLAIAANHSKDLTADVIKALVNSAKARCDGRVDIESIEMSIPKDGSLQEKRTIVRFSCVRTSEPNDKTSPVRDLAQGKTQAQTQPIPQQTDMPSSAELPVYSTSQGEPAGIVPTPEQRAFLERDVDLEPQTTTKKRDRLFK